MKPWHLFVSGAVITVVGVLGVVGALVLDLLDWWKRRRRR